MSGGYCTRRGLSGVQRNRPRDGPKIAVVNETFAHTWWPKESAIGHQIKVGGPYQEGSLLEIVGVAGDVRQSGLDSEPMPEIYLPSSQQRDSGMAIMIRASGDPVSLMASVRRRVLALDRNLPLQRPRYARRVAWRGFGATAF